MNTLMGELVSLQHFAFTYFIVNSIIFLLGVFIIVFIHCLLFVMFIPVTVDICRCL